jgi:hypothetical protein
LAWVPGAGLGTADGLICGKRFDALPAGIVVETPGMPALTSGTEPIGRLEPRLYVDPATPEPTVPPDPTVPPGPAFPPDPVVPPLLDPAGGVVVCDLLGLGLGLGED